MSINSFSSSPASNSAGQASRPNTPKASGLVLEAQTEHFLRSALPVWYTMARGVWLPRPGRAARCQVDFILYDRQEHRRVVVECKRCWHPSARRQIGEYVRLLEADGAFIVARAAPAKVFQTRSLEEALKNCVRRTDVVLLLGGEDDVQ